MLRNSWSLSYMGNRRGGAGGDPHFANVVLLSGFEGADGSTAPFSEESSSAKTITPFDGASIDTAQFKFGTSSGLITFAGANDYMRLDDSADWHFGTGDFTIEAFIRFSAVSNFHGIVGQYAGAGQVSWFFQYAHSGTTLQFGWSADGSAVTTMARTWAPSIDVWYHVATDRSSGVQRLYVDGVMLGTNVANTDNLFNSTTNLRIGQVNSNSLEGWIDELRITKGVARYASDGGFTPPTAAFPRS